MRRLMLFWPLFLALVLVGCEDGVFEPVPGTGGDTREVLLERTSSEQLIAGNSFTVRATVTDDGSPVAAGTDVIFTAVNSGFVSRSTSPANPVPTVGTAGTAEATVSTVDTDGSITVTATAGTASDTKTFSLVAR